MCARQSPPHSKLRYVVAMILFAVAGAAHDKFEPMSTVCKHGVWELPIAISSYRLPPGSSLFDSRATPQVAFTRVDPAPSRRHANTSLVRSFLYQNYSRSWVHGREELTLLGPKVFLVRFSPPATGLWQWAVVNATDMANGSFTVVSCPDVPGGVVRTSPSGQHFVLSDSGTGVFPIGENVAMPPRSNGTYGMEHYLNKLLAHGANAFRVWIGPSVVDNNVSYPDCPGTFSGPSFCMSPLILETKPREYSLANAWRIDWILRFAQYHTMYAHVVLDSWPQEIRDGEWNLSVFNTRNGGPLSLPFDMYSNLESPVTDMWLQRTAYVGSRFGAFRSVLGWELINEPDTPYLYSSAVDKKQYPQLNTFPMNDFIPWIRQLARALKAADQGQHLITTNFASSRNMYNITLLPEVTFLGYHDYQYQGGTTHALDVGQARSTEKVLRKAGQRCKPIFVSENGMVPGTLEGEDDPDGHGMKGSLWGTVTSAHAATSFSWWWDGVLIDNPNHTAYYSHYDGISRFVKQVDFWSFNWTTLLCNCKAAAVGCVATCATGVPLHQGPNATGVTLIWMRNSNFTYIPSTSSLRPIFNASIEILCQDELPPPIPAPGSKVQWFNTTTGEAMGTPEAAMIIPLPQPNPPYPTIRVTRPFVTDIAAIVTGPTQQIRCEGPTLLS